MTLERFLPILSYKSCAQKNTRTFLQTGLLLSTQVLSRILFYTLRTWNLSTGSTGDRRGQTWILPKELPRSNLGWRARESCCL